MQVFENMVLSLSFEMNLDQIIIERTIYTMLDLLADIGGFMSIILGGISFLLTLWNYKNFEYHFLTNFFKAKSSKAKVNNKI